MKVRFTRARREKLQQLGWKKIGKEDIVKSGYGKYSKDFGGTNVSILIRDHMIHLFQFSLLYQGTDVSFPTNQISNAKAALDEISSLGYFNL